LFDRFFLVPSVMLEMTLSLYCFYALDFLLIAMHCMLIICLHGSMQIIWYCWNAWRIGDVSKHV